VDLEARKKLGEVVKTARDSMSQRAFAKLLGVSYTTVQLWEKGESIPDVLNLANIADRAGYTIEELLNYLGIKPQSNSSDLNEIVKQIKVMPLSDVAVIGRVVMDRLASSIEVAGSEVKAS
jgi:transcriptional regulator with XRE-family HTH domain